MNNNLQTSNNKSAQILHLSQCTGNVRSTDLTDWSPTFNELEQQLTQPEIGVKDGPYMIRGQANQRSDSALNTAYVVILDGDKSIDLASGETKDGAPIVETVHQALKELDVSHILYTTHSHRDNYHRYRVVLPVYDGFSREQLKPCVNWLIQGLHNKNVPLADVPENSKWSNAWFFPRVDEGNPFVSYSHEGSKNILKLLLDRSHARSLATTATKQKPPVNRQKITLDDEIMIKSAIKHISAEDYDDWIKVGMAISHRFGDGGFDIFHNWSQQSSKYVDEDDCRNTYDGFTHKADNPVTLGTIIHMAQKKGWDRSSSRDDRVKMLKESTSDESHYDMTDELPRILFPDVNITQKGVNLKSTRPNFDAMLAAYKIEAFYDEVKKSPEVIIPGHSFHSDLNDNAVLVELKSLCSLNSMTKESTDYLQPILASNAINPVLDWITSKQWDEVDRIKPLTDSVNVTADCISLRDQVIPLWLIQCVAALDHAALTPNKNALPKFESVLVFQGDQGVKKTTWVSTLLPREHRKYIQTGGHLDVGNRDSEKIILSHWIVELGELDATFRKSDIAQLKAFLSKDTDQLRLPYDRLFNKYDRRTSFIASVNEMEFLTDTTGNRRFWPLTVTKLDDISIVDMQQLWAQVWKLYMQGEQWWPNSQLEEQLITATQKHEPIDIVVDLLADKFDLTNIDPADGEDLSSGEILSRVYGLQNTNSNNRKVANTLRGLGFTGKRKNSARTFRIKAKQDNFSGITAGLTHLGHKG